MARVVHFEIPADDIQRAIDFYRNAFNWRMMQWGQRDYWLTVTGAAPEPGIDGAIVQRADLTSTVNTIDVPSIDEYIERVIKAGGAVVYGKSAVPGIGYLAYCVDTEGNMFGMMQADESAA